MLKKTLLTALALTVAHAAGITRSASAAPPHYSAELAARSAYVWRGRAIVDDPVLQPSISVSHNGFGLNAWANFDLTDENGESRENEFTEVDLTASYSRYIGPAGVEAGVVEYLFPTDDFQRNTRELYLSIGFYDAWLSPAVDIFYDFDEVDDYYARLSIGHGVDFLADRLSLDLAFTAGYSGSDYNVLHFGIDDHGWHNASAGASVGFDLSRSLLLSVGADYVTFIEDDIRDAAAARYDDELTVVTVAMTLHF